jgi:hypothetical protein
VVRQSNGTNPSAANINIGAGIFVASTIEVAQVQEVTDGTTLQLNRGWYNIAAANSFVTGSVFQKLSSNVELVKMTTASTAVNGTQTISRSTVQYHSTHNCRHWITTNPHDWHILWWIKHCAHSHSQRHRFSIGWQRYM